MSQQLTDITDDLTQLIHAALLALDIPAPAKFTVERTRDASHGDFATNVALTAAKGAGMPPRALAEKLVAHLGADERIEKTDIAGPGFINFFLAKGISQAVITTILAAGDGYGEAPATGEKVLVEYVSANPTGPLHVGHGRGAAYGASLANVLAAAGHDVTREYYVNDAGRQMNILATSIWLRYLEQEAQLVFPVNGYKGAYIRDIAQTLREQHGDRFVRNITDVFADVPTDEVLNADGQLAGDKEAHIDGLINNAKALLGDNYLVVFNAGLDAILADIRDDLSGFGVTYNNWFSERSIISNIDAAVATLRELEHVYDKGGAQWFASEKFGDDKDRVLIRDNGEPTYFASDVAYHQNKFERGFDHIINIFGADHHGYIARIQAALKGLGAPENFLTVKLVQFAVLYRGAEKVQMSTRSGSFVTLRELREEVGNDAARFFYVMRSSDQHLDFDLELAKSQSNENPVYYIQYAHARVQRVLERLAEQGWTYDATLGLASLERLDSKQDDALLTLLAKYPETVATAARNYAPHGLAHYLRELAQAFHTCYNEHKILIDDAAERNARLALALATAQVIKNGLGLLGVSAPDSM